MKKLNLSKMENGKSVDDNLISLISKIGEKITIRRSSFLIKKEVKIIFIFIHQ